MVNKLLKWLMCEKDASPDDIYEMKSVIELMCSDVMEEYVEACFEAGYKASSLKTMEYTLSAFLLAMESLAAQHGLEPARRAEKPMFHHEENPPVRQPCD